MTPLLWLAVIWVGATGLGVGIILGGYLMERWDDRRWEAECRDLLGGDR